MLTLRPGPGVSAEKVVLSVQKRDIAMLVLTPKNREKSGPVVLWIHGGGYFLGMKEMVYASRAAGLVEKYGAVVVSPGYRLAPKHPYPAALEDCYAVLFWLRDFARSLGGRADQIMVGGESAGGGLAAALCMLARDKGDVNIAFQMPLYPMLDNLDTETSRENHGRVWNTRRNRLGWKKYLGDDARKADVSPYAAPARQTDYAGLPPCYTFVGRGEPFCAETLAYVEALKAAGVEAEADVYDTDYHAFDMLKPGWDVSKAAAERFNERFRYAMEHYFAPQNNG